MGDEHARGTPPVRWGIREAVLAFVVGVLLSALGAGIAESAINYHAVKGKPMPIGVTIAGLIGLWIGLGGGVVYAARFRGSGSVETDFGLRFHWPHDLAVGAVAGLASQYGLVPLLYLPVRAPRLHAPPSSRAAGQGGDPVRSRRPADHAPLHLSRHWGPGRRRAVLPGAPVPVVAPALRSHRRHRGLRRGASDWPTSSSLQLPALILFGLVLGVMAERTGRLGPGIVAHAPFNAATVLSLTVFR